MKFGSFDIVVTFFVGIFNGAALYHVIWSDHIKRKYVKDDSDET